MRRRLEAIDLARGIAMVLMALDHTRDFFGVAGDPTNLATASAPLFLTRWLTHFCAPAFFLLTGVGARLARSHRTAAALSRFLAIRGAWLIVVETILLRCLGYQFNVDFRVTMLLVLWALGWSMIVLAIVVHAGPRFIAAVGLILIAGHNALDGVRLTHPLWVVLHGPGLVFNRGGHVVFAAYPLIPWVGVTLVGYALGGLFTRAAVALPPTPGGEPKPTRQRWLQRGGTLAICLFVVLRWVNGYGDPSPWSPQPTALFTVLSFLNTTKYPPSLLFLLMTLGPVALLLGILDRLAARGPMGQASPILGAITTLGREPFFYYAGHFIALHLLAVAVCLVRYGDAHWMFESPTLAQYPFTPPPGWGFSLPVVYLIWLGVVVSLYPLCAWYGRVKQRYPAGWLRYL